MDQTTINFHIGLFFACLTYYFRFSEKRKNFFDEVYDYTSQVKSSITGEIADRFTKDLKPIPDIYITNPDGDVSYREGTPNPAKGEKFKNWLDDYLEDKTTFFIRYYQVKKLYKSWRWIWFALKYLALVLSIVELLLFVASIYWSRFCPKPSPTTRDYPFLCSTTGNDHLLFYSLLFSGICFMSGILLFVYVEGICIKLQRIKDKNVGL